MTHRNCLIFLLFLAATGPVAAAPGRAVAALSDDERAALLVRAADLDSVGDRLAVLTAPFVGTPYADSPLGEGEGVDGDPRLRWDRVDCLTFVETAIAGVAAGRLDRLQPVLDDLRYAASPATFLNRNHFVEAQWLPNNLLKGYLRDVSRDVGGAETRTVEKAYGPERWSARRQLGSMPLAAGDVPRGTWRLDIVPLPVVRARLARVRPGTLLFVVRRELYTQPTRVTHVGLVLDVGGRRVLRHASKRPFGRVVDERLDGFLARNAAYTRWPVEGVALYEIRVPGARVAEVAAAAGSGAVVPAAAPRP